MNNASRFERLAPPTNPVEIEFDGRKLALEEGGNLAAELLAAGVDAFRGTPVSGQSRGPFCMMGACFDCLVVINGVTEQACMIRVAAGQVITRAHGRAHD